MARKEQARRPARRRARVRQVVLRFDLDGPDALLWEWVCAHPKPAAAIKEVLRARTRDAAGAATAEDGAEGRWLREQLARLISILDRVTLSFGPPAPPPVGMSLGRAEPIRPMSLPPAPPKGEEGVTDESATLDQQVNEKLGKLLNFGDDL